MEYLGNQKVVNFTNPLVSICVPTFQHGSFIEECLNSILAQSTNFDFEILIGEDDSSDNTRLICKQFAENHQDRIRLFLRREEDKIIMFGRKAGRFNHLGLYGAARGKYVCICDGDDFWIDPLKLQYQVDFMEDNPKCFLCLTDTVIGLHPDKRPPGVPEGFRVYEKSELRKVFYMGHISSWMMRNEMSQLLQNPIVKKPIPLDQVLFSFYKSLGQTAFLPKVTSHYRFNPNGVYLSRNKRKNHKAVYKYSWYLYQFIHRDPLLLLQAVFYNFRRSALNFVLSRN